MADLPATAPTPTALTPGPFELSGGDLCLDYVNSWGDRARPETDQLRSFGDLLVFAGQTGLLDDARRRALTGRAVGAREEAAAFEAAVQLRESLYRILAGHARGREAPERDLEVLNAVLKEALTHLRIEALPAAGSGSLDWRWSFEPVNLPTAPLWPIARSAAELLVSPDIARVAQCDGSDCTWLFLDRSRTGNRRWCSMSSCGNRAKARRHYQRNKP